MRINPLATEIATFVVGGGILAAYWLRPSYFLLALMLTADYVIGIVGGVAYLRALPQKGGKT